MSNNRNNKSCLYKWQHNVLGYVISFSMMSLIYGMIWSGLSSVISSIEKRYSLTSFQSGFIFSASEVGRIPFLLIIGHFGNRFHIPRLVAISSLGIALSQLIIVLPHFIFTQENINQAKYIRETALFCDGTNESKNISINHQNSRNQANTQAYAVIVTGMVLMGMFASPNTNVAISYIDDNAEEGMTPIYLAIHGTAWAISPIIGSFLSAYFLTFFVDLSDVDLTPSDPAWIGAWWVIILTISIGMFLTAPFIGCHARKIRSHSVSGIMENVRKISQTHVLLETISDTNEKRIDTKYSTGRIKNTKTSKSSEYSLKGFCLAIWRLMTNPVFVFLTCYCIARDSAYWGFGVYTVKYMENIFYISASKATMYKGVSEVFAVLGPIAAAIVIRRLRLSLFTTLKICTISVIILVFVQVLLMCLGCPDSQLFGNITEYGKEIQPSDCNFGCNCTLAKYFPYCNPQTQLTYFSPCHAGCESDFLRNETLFNCSCSGEGVLVKGTCVHCESYNIILFLVGCYILTFIYSSIDMPITAILMRCVAVADKGLALGLHIFFLSLLSWLPVGVYYGRIVDAACSVWEIIDGTTGACWRYNLVNLRFYLFGLNIALQTVGFVCIAAALFIAKRKKLSWSSLELDKMKK